MEINEAERKKGERIKRNKYNLRDLWDNLKSPTYIMGVSEEDQKKGHEKKLEVVIVKNLTILDSKKPRSPKQDKPKAKHPKI